MATEGANYSYGLGTAQAYTSYYQQLAARQALREKIRRERTCFEILEVAPGASEAVIRAAYKALALRHHPDRGGSEEDMKRLNGALETALKAIVR